MLTPIAFQTNGDQARPFTFSQLEFNIRRGQDIGGYMQGHLGGLTIKCIGATNRITWDRGRTVSGLEWADRFYDVFQDIGYPVVGNPANPLERERERSRAEYIVVAQVTNLEVAICNQMNFFNERMMGLSGMAWMDINWQVQSLAERRVVFQGRTQGTGTVDNATQGSWEPVLMAAFEAAAHNLGADPEFHRVVSGENAAARTQVAAAQAAARSTINLVGPTVSRATIQDRMATVRMAVPTIVMGQGHGSGVFITEDGYLLTNDHVVKDRRQVTVRVQGGVEVIGEVLRRDEVRDIALVKVNLTRAAAVPIRSGLPAVGDEVYAVGTPLEQRLAQTVSRGIVSALRNERIPGSDRTQPLIQSDVMVQQGNSGGGLFDRNGNLIGITVSGAVIPGFTASTGSNNFIPIDHALEVLQITVQSQPRAPAR
ncbi:MAG: S1C family serine protease [Tagaea sp.]